MNECVYRFCVFASRLICSYCLVGTTGERSESFDILSEEIDNIRMFLDLFSCSTYRNNHLHSAAILNWTLA